MKSLENNEYKNPPSQVDASYLNVEKSDGSVKNTSPLSRTQSCSSIYLYVRSKLPPTGTQSDTESNRKHKRPHSGCLSVHGELFQVYTATKDKLSKPMPPWIFHTEKERGAEEAEGENGTVDRQKEAAKRRRLTGEH